MWWIPLLTTAASIGYEAIWGAPERRRLVREEREAREKEYRKWLEEYQRFLQSPIVTYPPEAIETAMRGIEETLSRQLAEIRPRLLEELQARGVSGSGIAEYPLGRLEQERLRTIGEARRGLELERLLAERQARLERERQRGQFLAGMMGAAYSPYEQAREAQYLLPFQQQAIWGQLLGGLAPLLAYSLAQMPTPTPTPTSTFLPPGLSLIPQGPRQYLLETLRETQGAITP